MLIVERYPCNNLNEAKERERFWIKELKATLNSSIPLRTKRECYQENKNKELKIRNNLKKNIKMKEM